MTLLWADDTNAVAVLIRDDSTDDQFELLVEPEANPIDVYKHPYAYAAWRASTTGPRTCGIGLTAPARAAGKAIVPRAPRITLLAEARFARLRAGEVNLVRDHLPSGARPRARMAMTGLARVPISYPLESKRLRLRPFTAGDLDALLAIQSRPDVARWLYWEPRGEEEVRAALEKKMTETTLENDGDSLSLAIVLKESSDLICDALLLLMSAEHRWPRSDSSSIPPTTATALQQRRHGCC